jgi:FkbH-like protein
MNAEGVDGQDNVTSVDLDSLMTPRLLGPRLEGLRYLLLGACQVGYLSGFAPEVGCRADHMLHDWAGYTTLPDIDLACYDAVIVGPTFRHIIREAAGGVLDLEFMRATDASETEATLRRCIAIIEDRVDKLHQKLRSVPTFFLSFQEPSFNYLGNLADRFGHSSPKTFMRALNAALETCLASRPNFHIVDTNEVMSAIGATPLHDDISSSFSHASILGDYDEAHDRGRLVFSTPIFKALDTPSQLRRHAIMLLNVLADNLKIIRQIDTVKLIIVDLDDTLWRGVAAEDVEDHWIRVEGWPLGFVEALLIFKRRGGLLAICSKNDHDATLERLATIWGGRIVPSDFASIRINWGAKSVSVSEILAETNILAKNVVFIDDNPREIDEVRAHHPDIRCLGGSHYDWRRVILRSPETQVPTISAESSRRTELVRAQINRNATSGTMSREQWLQSLQMEETITLFAGVSAPRFARCMELINKTNQFNTTGTKWALNDFEAFFAEGGVCVAASLRDKTVDNGIIGVALVRSGAIVQVVLSCRVFGLGAETALGRVATEVALQGCSEVRARIVDTGRNFACHGYFASIGFSLTGDEFCAHAACEAPRWIALSVNDERATAP